MLEQSSKKDHGVSAPSSGHIVDYTATVFIVNVMWL